MMIEVHCPFCKYDFYVRSYGPGLCPECGEGFEADFVYTYSYGNIDDIRWNSKIDEEEENE